MRSLCSFLLLFALTVCCLSTPASAAGSGDLFAPEGDAFLEEMEDPFLTEDGLSGPAVTDEEGRYQVWDPNGRVYAWIPVPEGYYADEAYTNRNALVLWPVDTDTLNADAAYFVYDMEDGYLDINMDDPLEEEWAYLQTNEDLVFMGPTPPETFTVGSREMMGSSLSISYEPDDGAPAYTTEYLIWTHLDERIIVTCHVGASSANPQPPLSMEDAGRMFLSPVSAE